MSIWKVDESETQTHWLSLKDDECRAYTASVRFDGCVHFRCYYNGSDWESPADEQIENSDYLHICDVDSMIERLQEIKRLAIAHFGEDWPS